MLNIACALLVELMLIGVLEFEELGNKIDKLSFGLMEFHCS